MRGQPITKRSCDSGWAAPDYETARKIARSLHPGYDSQGEAAERMAIKREETFNERFSRD